MKTYHRFSKSHMWFYQLPVSFAKLIVIRNKFFDKKKLTYYPERPQKSTLRILCDQILHIFKYGFTNDEYYYYGLDVKGAKCSDFICELWSLDNLVYFQNNHPYSIKVAADHDYSYNGCLRDKWFFALLMNEFGLPTPNTIGLIKSQRFTKPGFADQPLSELSKQDMDVMVKPIEVNGGEGIFHLKIKDGVMTIGGKVISVEQLSEKVGKGIFIVQSFIDNQHEDMKTLFPGAVNTLRITLVQNGKGDSELLGVMCMMGAHGAECSNWHFGGVCANVKSDGTVDKYGYSMSDKRVLKHPDSGVVFEGYKIPYYNEAVALAKRCMKSFYGLKSVGWDIAITTDGPIVIEGNDDWGLAAHQMVENKGWADRYFKYMERR